MVAGYPSPSPRMAAGGGGTTRQGGPTRPPPASPSVSGVIPPSYMMAHRPNSIERRADLERIAASRYAGEVAKRQKQKQQQQQRQQPLQQQQQQQQHRRNGPQRIMTQQQQQQQRQPQQQQQRRPGTPTRQQQQQQQQQQRGQQQPREGPPRTPPRTPANNNNNNNININTTRINGKALTKAQNYAIASRLARSGSLDSGGGSSAKKNKAVPAARRKQRIITPEMVARRPIEQKQNIMMRSCGHHASAAGGHHEEGGGGGRGGDDNASTTESVGTEATEQVANKKGANARRRNGFAPTLERVDTYESLDVDNDNDDDDPLSMSRRQKENPDPNVRGRAGGASYRTARDPSPTARTSPLTPRDGLDAGGGRRVSGGSGGSYVGTTFAGAASSAASWRRQQSPGPGWRGGPPSYDGNGGGGGKPPMGKQSSTVTVAEYKFPSGSVVDNNARGLVDSDDVEGLPVDEQHQDRGSSRPQGRHQLEVDTRNEAVSLNVNANLLASPALPSSALSPANKEGVEIQLPTPPPPVAEAKDPPVEEEADPSSRSPPCDRKGEDEDIDARIEKSNERVDRLKEELLLLALAQRPMLQKDEGGGDNDDDEDGENDKDDSAQEIDDAPAGREEDPAAAARKGGGGTGGEGKGGGGGGSRGEGSEDDSREVSELSNASPDIRPDREGGSAEEENDTAGDDGDEDDNGGDDDDDYDYWDGEKSAMGLSGLAAASNKKREEELAAAATAAKKAGRTKPKKTKGGKLSKKRRPVLKSFLGKKSKVIKEETEYDAADNNKDGGAEERDDGDAVVARGKADDGKKGGIVRKKREAAPAKGKKGEPPSPSNTDGVVRRQSPTIPRYDAEEGGEWQQSSDGSDDRSDDMKSTLNDAEFISVQSSITTDKEAFAYRRQPRGIVRRTASRVKNPVTALRTRSRGGGGGFATKSKREEEEELTKRMNRGRTVALADNRKREEFDEEGHSLIEKDANAAATRSNKFSKKKQDVESEDESTPVQPEEVPQLEEMIARDDSIKTDIVHDDTLVTIERDDTFEVVKGVSYVASKEEEEEGDSMYVDDDSEAGVLLLSKSTFTFDENEITRQQKRQVLVQQNHHQHVQFQKGGRPHDQVDGGTQTSDEAGNVIYPTVRTVSSGIGGPIKTVASKECATQTSDDPNVVPAAVVNDTSFVPAASSGDSRQEKDQHELGTFKHMMEAMGLYGAQVCMGGSRAMLTCADSCGDNQHGTRMVIVGADDSDLIERLSSGTPTSVASRRQQQQAPVPILRAPTTPQAQGILRNGCNGATSGDVMKAKSTEEEAAGIFTRALTMALQTTIGESERIATEPRVTLTTRPRTAINSSSAQHEQGPRTPKVIIVEPKGNAKVDKYADFQSVDGLFMSPQQQRQNGLQKVHVPRSIAVKPKVKKQQQPQQQPQPLESIEEPPESKGAEAIRQTDSGEKTKKKGIGRFFKKFGKR